jgi:hypothetical protein
MVQNDQVLVGPKANFTAPNRKLLDQGIISAVVDSTHIQVINLTQAHASGEYVVLDECASAVVILPVTTAHPIYVGTDETVGATDASTFDYIAAIDTPMQPTYFHSSTTTGNSDAYQTSQYWLLGTAGDTFVARFQQG